MFDDSIVKIIEIHKIFGQIYILLYKWRDLHISINILYIYNNTYTTTKYSWSMKNDKYWREWVFGGYFGVVLYDVFCS